MEKEMKSKLLAIAEEYSDKARTTETDKTIYIAYSAGIKRAIAEIEYGEVDNEKVI